MCFVFLAAMFSVYLFFFVCVCVLVFAHILDDLFGCLNLKGPFAGGSPSNESCRVPAAGAPPRQRPA